MGITRKQLKRELKRLTKKKRKKQPKKTQKQRAKAGVKQRKRYKKKYQDYLKSKEWAEIKLDLYQTRGKKCEVCGSNKRIEVHHKHYNNVFKEEPNDLLLLCHDCHSKEHKKQNPLV